jgi:aspartyl protease family protein
LLAGIFWLAAGSAGGQEFPPDFAPSVETEIREAGSSVELVIPPGPRGHFFVRGTINGREVLFVVDTGASMVMLPKTVADKIGLNGSDETNVVSTAAGLVTVSPATIDSLVLGPIRLARIDAVINPSDSSGLVLLGMSALKQLKIAQEGGRMVLKQSTAGELKIKRSVRECMGEKKVVDKETLRCIRGEGAE